MYVEKGEINITAKDDSVKNAVITGSKLNDENKEFQAFIKTDMDAVNKKLAAAPEDKKKDPAFR